MSSFPLGKHCARSTVNEEKDERKDVGEDEEEVEDWDNEHVDGLSVKLSAHRVKRVN
ncbi:GH11078 [Drosophila grimshawi]|uniref:GH11078 n=1 Tax=Drosophila grimshawi TaxID=7222 RepID=B4JCJ3_DROGR|nr:GH11078 [Drosophila grimshawi]